MKQLIVLAAILPVLLLFAAQFTLQQQNAAARHFVTGAVDAAKEQAKRDGYFTDDNIDALKTKIAGALKIEKDEVIVIAAGTPRYRTDEYGRSGQIYYRVEVPVKQIMAGARLLGISSGQNQGRIIIENVTASELLIP